MKPLTFLTPMKIHIFICTLLSCVTLQAQQQDITEDPTAQPTLEETTVAITVKSTSTRATPTIIGRLAGEPDLSPPRPAPPPPPRLLIPPENTLTSKTHNLGDHTVTIQEVIPVVLPPRPAPNPSAHGATSTSTTFAAFLISNRATPSAATSTLESGA